MRMLRDYGGSANEKLAARSPSSSAKLLSF
jgi:hypothetical protein